MKVVDLFCGTGGWSIGFHREGFQCIGVDKEDIGYPYQLSIADVLELRTLSTMQLTAKFGPVDVVVASPPCNHFSLARGRIPDRKAGMLGMVLVDAALDIILKINPEFWALENVRGAVPYITERLGRPRYARPPHLLL